MIITINGDQGSGKSTIAKLLAKELNYKHYSTGDYMRKMAENYDMNLEDFGKYAENNKEIDKELDRWQTEIGKKEDDFVIDARLGWHFMPNSIKIFFKCNEDIAAERIFNDNAESRKKETKVKTLEEKKKQIKLRKESEKIRYEKFYGKNIYDMKNYDILIDTSKLNIKEVLKKVIEELKNKKYL